MKREKEYLYKVDITHPDGRVVFANVSYNPDQPKPWRVRIDFIQVSPYYASIGPTQRIMKRYASQYINTKSYYMQRQLLLDKLQVPLDRR